MKAFKGMKILGITAVLILSACGTTPFKVVSDPDQAQVFIVSGEPREEKPIGLTPLLKTDKELEEYLKGQNFPGGLVNLVVKKDGYKTKDLWVPINAGGHLGTHLVLKLDQTKSRDDEMKTAQDLLERLFLSQQFAKTSQLERALIEIDKVLEVYPKFDRALSMKAAIHYAKGEFEESLKWYENALAVNPELKTAIDMAGKVRETLRMPTRVPERLPADDSSAQKSNSTQRSKGKSMKLRQIIFLGLILLFSAATAQQSNSKAIPAKEKSEEAQSPLRRADVVSVKAALEDMLVRRYAQELSAMVSYDRFNVGARFELIVVDEKDGKRNQKNNETYTDLDLGYLDADTLFDRYSNIESGTVSPLAKYAIKAVSINVGIQENMGEQIKKSVNDWLQARIKDEFGSIGKGQVQFIQSENSNPSTMDRIIQMQGLVGQLILAIAILLGVILWRLLSSGAQKSEPMQSSVNIESKTEMKSGDGAFGSSNSQSLEDSKESALENKMGHLSSQIKDLAPRLVDQLDSIISQWSDLGDEGMMQIACFAEITGSVLGSLPIPKEHKKKMGDVFAKMSALSQEKRHEVINRVYWDLVASLNLGTDALHRPFSFLGSSTLGTVNQVLLGNDVDIQTVVSLYMPESMRKNYFSKLENDKKIELLNTAAKLSTISQEKLKNIESKIAPYFEEKVDETEVSLSMTLNKLIESMSILDSCRIMSQVQGPMVEEYKLKHPHLGFFLDWTASTQETLIKKSTNEELMAYIRVVPEMKPIILELISPRAKQILEDDLSREDNVPEVEKERLLQSLHNRLLNLVYTNVVTLEEAIKKKESLQGKGLSVAA